MQRLFGITAALVLALTARPLLAQQHADSMAYFPWTGVALSVRGGPFRSSANSDAHRVLERALTPGLEALEPLLVGVSLHVPLTARWGVHAGVDGGRRTTRSESRVRPPEVADPVRQQTQFSLASFVHAGLDVVAWRWHDRTSLVLTGGVGRAAYTLQQTGRFVDVDRLVVFDDVLASRGRGTVGYLGAAADVAVTRAVSVRMDVRRQYGSATMSGDFAGFKRFDLGGARVSGGLVLRPFAR
jgi:hypothetical protein